MNLEEYSFVFLDFVMTKTMDLIDSQIVMIQLISAFHHHNIRLLVKELIYSVTAFRLLGSFIDSFSILTPYFLI